MTILNLYGIIYVTNGVVPERFQGTVCKTVNGVSTTPYASKTFDRKIILQYNIIIEVHYMGIEEIYSDEYLEETYFNKKCTQCRNKCDKCTKDMVVERFYVRHRGLVIPTAIYKCNNFELEK